MNKFEQDLQEFLRDKETKIGSVYAIKVDTVSVKDEVAEVTVYTTSNNDVVSNKYVVIRRNNLFEFKKII